MMILVPMNELSFPCCYQALLSAAIRLPFYLPDSFLSGCLVHLEVFSLACLNLGRHHNIFFDPAV